MSRRTGTCDHSLQSALTCSATSKGIMTQLSTSRAADDKHSVSAADTIARLLRDRVLADAAASGVARRDAHPKAHGLVAATFTVAQ